MSRNLSGKGQQTAEQRKQLLLKQRKSKLPFGYRDINILPSKKADRYCF